MEAAQGMGEAKKSASSLSGLPTKPPSPRGQRIRSSGRKLSNLTIDAGLFNTTLRGLQERSAGWRESAAIWAGHVDASTWKAEEVQFHHDLCDDLAGPLSLQLSEKAKYDLYIQLGKKGFRLVGLVHTHPHKWVDLSEVDKENQVCSRLGFWSLVIPQYASPPWIIAQFGVHVRVEDGWYRLNEFESSRQLIIKP
jgi:hypothetical protein